MDLIKIAIGFGLALIIALVSYRFKALTLSGAVGTILVGTIVFGLGELPFSIPLLFFFISGSLLSSVTSESKAKALLSIGKTGARDIMQVGANGFFAAGAVIVYFFTEDILWYYLFLSALAEATADTWATEIGSLSLKPPVSIISFKAMIPGQSGGVTSIGLMASLIGALFLAICGYGSWEIWGYGSSLEISTVIAIALVGFGGSLIDSILGATVQAQYKCEICDSVTELKKHCDKPTRLTAGNNLIGNDLVNFISVILAALLFLAFYRIIYI